MGLGNGNPNSGNKGSNWRYEYNVLKALECIVENTESGGGAGCCPATNALLTEIRDNTADIEITAESINLNTDQLEALIAITNANQTNKTQFTKITDGTDTALVTAAGELNVIATAQPGVDIGDVTVNNAGGAAAVNIQDGGNSITVDGSLGITTIVPGTGATNLGKAEDAASVDGDTGVMILAKRVDTASTQTTTDGDYTTPVANANGQLRVGINRTFQTTDNDSLLKAEDAAHTTGDAGVLSLAIRNDANATLTTTDLDYSGQAVDGAGNTKVVGDVNDNAAQVNLKPAYVGGKAVNSNSYVPAYTDGDAVGSAFDKTNGGLLTNQGNLSATNDTITVYGASTTVKPALVIDTAIYAANDNMGGKQTITSAMFTSAGSAYLDNIGIQVLENVTAAFEIWLFNSDPTAGTYTDNAAMVVGTTDILKVIDVITVNTADYKTVGTTLFANISVKKLYTASGSTNLYAAYKLTNAPDFAGTGNLQIQYNFDRVK